MPATATPMRQKPNYYGYPIDTTRRPRYESSVLDNRNYDFPNTAQHMYLDDPYSQVPPPQDMRGNMGYQPYTYRNPMDTDGRQPYPDNYYPNSNSGPPMYPPNPYTQAPPRDTRENMGY